MMMIGGGVNKQELHGQRVKSTSNIGIKFSVKFGSETTVKFGFEGC